jgi:hypothetical protein
MKATRNKKNGLNQTTLENLSITQRNIILTALLSKKAEHFNGLSQTSKIYVKEITAMVNEILDSMENYSTI